MAKQEAEKEMKNYLSRIDFNNSFYSIISNYTATASNEKKILFENLSNQMSNKVRWAESIKLLDKMGEKIIIEMGPGKVLSGLIKRISNNFSLYNFNSIQLFCWHLLIPMILFILSSVIRFITWSKC